MQCNRCVQWQSIVILTTGVPHPTVLWKLHFKCNLLQLQVSHKSFNRPTPAIPHTRLLPITQADPDRDIVDFGQPNHWPWLNTTRHVAYQLHATWVYACTARQTDHCTMAASNVHSLHFAELCLTTSATLEAWQFGMLRYDTLTT